MVAAAIARRRRESRRRPAVTDEMVRRIESVGHIEADQVDPLDLDEARAQEDAFWEQTWDEPEEL